MPGFHIERLKKLKHIHVTQILDQQIARSEESEYTDDTDNIYALPDDFLTPQSQIERNYFLVSYLALEETLLDYGRRTTLEYFKEETFVSLFLGTANGVNYLHENQIIHCNLNASNIFIRRIPKSKQVSTFILYVNLKFLDRNLYL